MSPTGGLLLRFFPLAVEDLSCPLTVLPRVRLLRPPTTAEAEANESIKCTGVNFCIMSVGIKREQLCRYFLVN